MRIGTSTAMTPSQSSVFPRGRHGHSRFRPARLKQQHSFESDLNRIARSELVLWSAACDPGRTIRVAVGTLAMRSLADLLRPSSVSFSSGLACSTDLPAWEKTVQAQPARLSVR